MFAVDQVVGIEINHNIDNKIMSFLEFNSILNPFEMEDYHILNTVDAYHILLMRGFFVDLLKNGSISLSENMAWRSQDVCKNDPDYMRYLFEGELLITHDGIIEWSSGFLTGRVAKKVFTNRHVTKETEFFRDMQIEAIFASARLDLIFH